MGAVETEKYIRKPLYVDAVRVSAQNFDDVVTWCQGEVETDEVPGQGTTKKYIKVRVHNPKNPRQTKAFIGDWILYTERGYKVYTNKAFKAAFDQVAEHANDDLNESSSEANAGGSVTTPQGEPIEIVEATPQAIADIVNEQQPVGRLQTETAEDGKISHEPVDRPENAVRVQEPKEPGTFERPHQGSPSAPPEDREARLASAENDKRVLTRQEQETMGQDEVRELIRSGEVVLEQDLAVETPQA